MKGSFFHINRWLLKMRRMLPVALFLGLVIVGAGLAQTGSGASTALPSTTPFDSAQDKFRTGSTGYDLTWWTVDGGGATVNGGGYTLMGTNGQPESGPVLTGGGYSLVGGFWSGVGEATPAHTPTPTPTHTPPATPTGTVSPTPTTTTTGNPTLTPSPTATHTPTATRTATSTATPTATPTGSRTVTPTATATVSLTPTPEAYLYLPLIRKNP
ncbi:MAG: hypothetical protein ACE5HA_05330 [Anaerolineae bacterium]